MENIGTASEDTNSRLESQHYTPCVVNVALHREICISSNRETVETMVKKRASLSDN